MRPQEDDIPSAHLLVIEDDEFFRPVLSAMLLDMEHTIASKVGSDWLLTKPFARADLVEAITAVMNRE